MFQCSTIFPRFKPPFLFLLFYFRSIIYVEKEKERAKVKK